MAIGNLLCWLRRGRIIGAAGGGKRGACTSGARVCTNGMRASRAGSVGASTAGKPQRSPFAKVGTCGGGLSGPGVKREGGAAKSRRAGGGWQSHSPPSLRAVAPLYRPARGRNTGAPIPSRRPATAHRPTGVAAAPARHSDPPDRLPGQRCLPEKARCVRGLGPGREARTPPHAPQPGPRAWAGRLGAVPCAPGTASCPASRAMFVNRERNPEVPAAVGHRRYPHAHDHRHHHVCTVRGVTGIVRDNGRTEQLHCLARGQESFHL